MGYLNQNDWLQQEAEEEAEAARQAGDELFGAVELLHVLTDRHDWSEATAEEIQKLRDAARMLYVAARLLIGPPPPPARHVVNWRLKADDDPGMHALRTAIRAGEDPPASVWQSAWQRFQA